MNDNYLIKQLLECEYFITKAIFQKVNYSNAHPMAIHSFLTGGNKI